MPAIHSHINPKDPQSKAKAKHNRELALSVCLNAPLEETTFGVFRM